MDKLVFISHNSKDKGIAREIALFLVSEDVNVWFDEWEVSYGESIPKAVNEGLKQCTHFLLLWSKNAAEAPWVLGEVDYAIRSLFTNQDDFAKVIPICLDETDLPPLVSPYRYIKYSDGSENDRLEIVSAVTGQQPSRNYVKAVVKKYKELVFDNEETEDPFGLKVCPNCGECDFEHEGHLDDEHDEQYYFITCKKCGWGNWTQ